MLLKPESSFLACLKQHLAVTTFKHGKKAPKQVDAVPSGVCNKWEQNQVHQFLTLDAVSVHKLRDAASIGTRLRRILHAGLGEKPPKLGFTLEFMISRHGNTTAKLVQQT